MRIIATKMLKRIFDFTFSLLGLVILAPLFLLIAILIKLEDKGPVFYRGLRVGYGGGLFKIYKFRTMVIDAEKKGGSCTAEDDSRITKIGKLFRKYKLDEIPQLINVMEGTMSIVGPRPEVIYYVNMYTEEEKKILTVKPGITDRASLWDSDEGMILTGSSDPEKTYMQNIRPVKLKLQLEYVKYHNFFIDLKIVLLTLHTIIRKIRK